MGWLADLFGSNTGKTRKGQALSSTHDAFSLPTSSPGLSPHPDAFNPDAFNPDALQTPDPDSAMSPSYTYPPRGPGAYGYIPTSAGLSSRPTSASLLPTHMDPLHSPLSPHYPPLSKTWNRLRAWLSREYPELGDTLNYGILPQDLAQIEMQFGFALPAVVRESYLCVDGQEAESAAGCSEGLFFGLTLLPLDDVLDEWRFWREVDDDPSTGANPRLREMMQSIPSGWVRREYSQRGWIPLIADKIGNYVGIDLNPGDAGAVGQVIVFGRDFDTKVVLWRGDGSSGWAKWLACFVEELESGEGFEIGSSDVSEGSEDDLGYEGYYNDGRGQGDGGGDNGSAGMRLTGEYRGWNVLEAWADRSVRKWHEAGVISDTSLPSVEEDVKGKAVEKGPLVVELPQESAAEIPIPVLADAVEHIPPPTATALNTHRSLASKSKPPHNLPTISVSRPPAPLPVELPTPRDIAPSSSLPSFEEDLETGMREVSHEEASLVSASAPRRAQTIAREISESSESAIPASSSAVDVPLVAAAPASPTDPLSGTMTSTTLTVIPDLLADSAPALGTAPIEPSPSPKVEVSAIEQLLVPSTSQEIPVVAQEEEEQDLDPDATIRLVGGGGLSGVVVPEPEHEPEAETPAANGKKDSDTQSLASITSDTSTKKSEKGHKKTKSGLAGLKKLGLGRKRDSTGSVKSVKGVKETAVPATN
ncbi:hypothetical protein BDQ17DRAFT_1274370 [Cyathus striatus]|nr:hypothetical protein BDQ17DRAFT_1274370 [Cyathus striatus]